MPAALQRASAGWAVVGSGKQVRPWLACGGSSACGAGEARWTVWLVHAARERGRQRVPRSEWQGSPRTHPLTHSLRRAAGKSRYCGGVVLCECQASQDIGWHCTKTAAAQCPSQISAENAASLWKDPPATRPILGSLALSRNEHPAQFGILGHAGNNGQPQLAPAARSGDLVGTAAPHLLKEVAPASRLPARDSKARAGSDHNTRLRDSPAVLVAFPGAALQTNWNSWKRLGTVSLDTHVCDPSIPSPAQHTIDNPRAQ
jgi:hypothetical protein